MVTKSDDMLHMYILWVSLFGEIPSHVGVTHDTPVVGLTGRLGAHMVYLRILGCCTLIFNFTFCLIVLKYYTMIVLFVFLYIDERK